MIFPLLAALMAIAAALWVVRPLAKPALRARGAGPPAAAYRAALERLERERAAGLVGDIEAERAALARAFLAAGEEAPAAGQKPLRAATLAVLAALPLLGGLAYLAAGGDLRLAAGPPAQSAEDRQLETLVRRLSERVTRQSDDAEGYRLLGMGLVSLGRPGEAAQAYRTAVALGSRAPATLAALGETLTLAQGGVSAEALQAFDDALKGDPDEPTALLFRGQARFESGRLAEAKADWSRLLAAAPADAPWRAALAGRLAALDKAQSAQDIAALDPQARRAAIEGMVASLAARLESDPRDLDGWRKLIHSYGVLGEPQKAREARDKARAVFKDDADALAALGP